MIHASERDVKREKTLDESAKAAEPENRKTAKEKEEMIMNMKIYDVKDMNHFIDTVDSCKGSVILSFDGKSFDLKKDPDTCRILRYMRPACDTLYLSVADEEDCRRMISYMMQAS